jgi:glycosyltransferase involved in cell wall biosynthesis
MTDIPVRIGIQQRVLPYYRVPFFDALAERCPQGLSVFAGKPRSDEGLSTGAAPLIAHAARGRNVHLFKGMAYLCWQSGLMDWLSAWQPELLVMEANPRYLQSRRAISWMKSRGRQVIGWGLGSPAPESRFAALRLMFRRQFIQRFDALITYSQSGAQEYASLGFPPEYIFVAPNAVAPRPGHSLPDRQPIFSPTPLVLFVGRLQARKQVDTLIRACAQLPPRMQPRLWIIGDGPLRRELESLAASLYPAASFLGAQHGAELEHAMCQADLFVLPGTGGLAVQQAMSFGLPVIVGRSDGTQGDLVRPENGWIYAGDGPAELADLLQDALNDVKRLRVMGAASYRIVQDEINLEAMVAAFVHAIRKTLEV